MKKFFALLRLSVKSMLLTTYGVSRGKRKKAVTGVGVIVLIAFLGLYLSGIYSTMLLQVLAPMGMEELVFIFMGIGALVGGLLFTTFAVKGVVFGGKDNDLLLSMPVPASMLMASRVVAIYLENLIFAFFVLVPAGVACALMSESGAGQSVGFWVRALVAALALPLLDTALSVVLGAVVAFVSARLSKGALGQNIFMAALFVGIFYFSFNLSSMINDLAANAAGLKEAVGWALPLIWMGEGIMGDWGRLLGFVAMCALPFAVMVFTLGRVYRKAVTAFQAKSARSDYRLSTQSAAGQKKALLRKEARRFFGDPTYLWNAGVGLMLMVIMGIAALIGRETLREVLGALRQVAPGLPVVPIGVGIMGLCLTTAPIAAPSVSLEGKYFWILREGPVEARTILLTKLNFHMALALPCTVVTALCLALALALPMWEGALLLAGAVVLALGHGFFCLLMGIAFARMDAANDGVIIKRSMAVNLSVFVPMGVLALAGVLCWLGSRWGAALSLALPLALLAALAAVCGAALLRKGPAMLERL